MWPREISLLDWQNIKPFYKGVHINWVSWCCFLKEKLETLVIKSVELWARMAVRQLFRNLQSMFGCSLPQDENLRGWCNWQINKPIYNISAPAVLFPYLDDQKQWLTFHWHCLKNKMWWHYLDAFVVLVGPNKCWRSRSRSRLFVFLWRGAPAAY